MSSGAPDGWPGDSEFLASQIASACRQYTEQAILTESPAQRTLQVFDLILEAARKGQAERVREGLQELLGCLDFRYEAAWNFQTFYEACLQLVAQGELAEVQALFRQLRRVWAQAFRLETYEEPRSLPFFRSVPRRGLETQA